MTTRFKEQSLASRPQPPRAVQQTEVAFYDPAFARAQEYRDQLDETLQTYPLAKAITMITLALGIVIVLLTLINLFCGYRRRPAPR